MMINIVSWQFCEDRIDKARADIEVVVVVVGEGGVQSPTPMQIQIFKIWILKLPKICSDPLWQTQITVGPHFEKKMLVPRM